MAKRTTISLTLTKIPAPPPPAPPPQEVPRLAIELRSPVQDRLRDYALENLQTRPLFMVLPDVAKGKRLALCGAGPSLATAEFGDADHIIACNSALPYLWGRGVKVTAGLGIDQTPALLREWASAPPVPYLLASTVDPALVRYLVSQGRVPIFFHSYVGFGADEFDFYCHAWPPGFMVGQGTTVVARAIGLAEWMGYETITVYGADHAFGPDDVTHASGVRAVDAYNNPLIMQGVIDGRTWRTRPDMLMAAVELVRRARQSEGRVRLVGDTLPNALMRKDEAFLDEVCRKLAPGEWAESVM